MKVKIKIEIENTSTESNRYNMDTVYEQTAALDLEDSTQLIVAVGNKFNEILMRAVSKCTAQKDPT